MKSIRAAAFLIILMLLAGSLPVSAFAGENAPDSVQEAAPYGEEPQEDAQEEEADGEEPQEDAQEEEPDGEEPQEDGQEEDPQEDAQEADDAQDPAADSPQAAGQEVPSEGQETGPAFCRILFPAEQTGYVIRYAKDPAVASGESFTFFVAVSDEYRKGAEYAVKAGNAVLKAVPAKPAGAEAKDSAGTPGAENTEDAAGKGGVPAAPGAENTPGAGTGEKDPGAAADAGADPASAPAADGTGGAAAADGFPKQLPGYGSFEKYVIAKVTADIQITVNGLESISGTQDPGTAADPAAVYPAGGQNPDEYPADAAPQDQYPAVGQEPDEYPADESPADDDPEDQFTVDGQNPDEYPADAAPQDQYPADGQEPDEYPADESPADNEPEDQFTVDGQNPDEYPADAAPQERYPADGQGQDEYPEDEYPADADPQEQYPADGIIPSSADPEEGMENLPAPTEETSFEDDDSAQEPAAQAGESEDGTAASDGDSATQDTDDPADQGTVPGEDDSAQDAAADAGDTAQDAAAAVGGGAAGSPGETADADQGEAKTLYPVFIGSVQASSGNADDLLGDGSARYDAATRTLTLRDAKIKGTGSGPAVIRFTGDSDFTVLFSGTCSITSEKAMCGILSEKGSLTLQGTGTLTVKTAAAGKDACIRAGKGDITILSGTVTAQCTGKGYGIRAANIRIRDGIRKVQASAAKTAFSAGSAIVIDDTLGISSPKGGALSKDKKTIEDAEGKTAAAAAVEPLPVYTVTFSPEGGSGSMSARSVLSGKKIRLPSCAFNAPQCRKFDAWKIGSKSYAPGDEVRVTGDITVKAVWAEDHHLSKIARTEPECEKDGNIAYYVCSVCGKYFSDSGAKEEITKEKTVLKAIGHKWGEAVYTWNPVTGPATAKRVCKNNAAHVQTETASPTKTGTGATCEKDGSYTYIVSFSNSAFKQQQKTVTEKALGHKWANPVFSWSSSNTSAEVTFTCERDKSHKLTEDAAVKGAITLPTKTANGRIVYTGTIILDNKEYTDKRETAISPAGTNGYRFDEKTETWTKNSGSRMSFKIKRGSYDTITYEAFSGITVDGKTVSKSDYSTSKGSLKLRIDSDYLQKLEEGSHTLVVDFKDGTAEMKFTIKPSRSSPRTGDENTTTLWMALFTIAGLGLAGICIALRTKRH